MEKRQVFAFFVSPLACGHPSTHIVSLLLYPCIDVYFTLQPITIKKKKKLLEKISM